MPLQYAANATVDISVQAVEISLNMSPSSADTTVHIVSEEETVILPVYGSDSAPITTGNLSVITTLEFEDTDHVIQPPVDGYKTVNIDPLPSTEEESFNLDLLPVQLVPFIFEVQTDNLVYHDYDYYIFTDNQYVQRTTDPNHATLSLQGNGIRLTEITWLPSATPSPGAAVISSPADSYTLPTVDGGVYNCTVEWGDGTTSTITSWNQSEVTHQYPSAGKYRIKISGQFEGINFHRHEELNHHDHLKLLDVISWGDDSKMDIAGHVSPFNPHGFPNIGSNGIMTSSTGMFCGCKNWNDVSGGAPNWGTCGTAKTRHPDGDGRKFGGSALITIFYGNSSLQADISVWTTEDRPFTGNAYRHFQYRPRVSDIDTFKANFHWLVGNGNHWQMFANSGVVSAEGNSLLRSNGNSRFEVSNWKLDSAAPNILWQTTFIGNNNMDPDVSNLVGPNVSSVAYIFNGANSFTGRGLENWDISGIDTNSGNGSGFTSAFAGTPINKILPWTFAFGARLNSMLYNCDLYDSPCNGWGTSGVYEAANVFALADNFNNGGVSWTDADWTNCRTFSGLFRKTSFNQDVSRWKLSTTRDFSMKSMFMQTPFNRPVNTTVVDGVKYWDMSRCTNTSQMFYGCGSFNQPLDAWDMSNVTDTSSMFRLCQDFNQDLSSWDVSSVEDFNTMFRNANSFNQDLSSWNTSSATDMKEMFAYNSSFNGNVSNWDVSNVTSLNNTFLQATSFTGQGLSTWRPSSALTRMVQTFYSATSLAVDTDLGAWDVSGVKNFDRCFYNSDITGVNLDNWDVSSAEILAGMFYAADNFNTDISGWDVSKAKDLRAMFKSATSFDQDLSSWNLSSLDQNIDVYEIPYGDDPDTVNYEYQGFRTLADGSTGIYSGMFGIFANSGMSKTNLDLTISGWCDSSNTPDGSTLPGGELQLDVIPLNNSSESQRLNDTTINKMKDKNMTAKYTDGNFVY